MAEPRGLLPLVGRLAFRSVVAIAALLAVGVLWTRVRARAAEVDYPPLGEAIEVDGLRQQVLVRGEGPPVVFVHGAYGGSHDFAATILDAASERWRCVVWDRPGHGYSERPYGEADPGVQADVLVGLIEALRLERPLLVGFSYGGAVCLAAALRAPDRIRGVVMLNGPSHPWPDPLEFEYRLDATPVLGRLVSEALVTPLSTWMGEAPVEAAFAPLPVPPEFEASPIPLALRPASYRANTQDIRLLKPFLRAQARDYPELRVPVVAIVSEDDTVVSPTIHLPALVQEAPNARQIRLPNAGHQILYTHPELVLDTIAEALAETEAGGAPGR